MPCRLLSRPALLAAMVSSGLVLFSGCSTYLTPGGGSAPWIGAQTDEELRAAYDRRPAAQFPAHVVAVRIQQPGYSNARHTAVGEGRFSVMTTREVESAEDLAALGSVTGVAQWGALNRLVLPRHLESLDDLRQGAAQLQADVLLVYTLDTSFVVKGAPSGPLQFITLGFIPDKNTYVTTTASAALLDVRTGYFYGLAEATAREDGASSMWKQGELLDRLRVETEGRAFHDLVSEITVLWEGVVAKHATSSTAHLALPE
ncbi:MAG: hypothetical protein ACOC3I_08100 [Verrucomicrobiota bacterium]